MESNIEIIKKVTLNTHSAEKLKTLSRYYASDFTYKDPFKRAMNFEEHCQHMEIAKQSCEFEIISIEDNGDSYEMKVGITVFHGDTKVRSQLVSRVRFYFEDGIILKIKSYYYPTPMQLLYYWKIFSPNGN